MSVMAEFSIVPVGKGESISTVIADVMRIVVDSGVSYKAKPMGTVLEGDWDAVMSVVKQCHAAVMRQADRAITVIKIDDRKAAGPRMDGKLDAVEQKLGRKINR